MEQFQQGCALPAVEDVLSCLVSVLEGNLAIQPQQRIILYLLLAVDTLSFDNFLIGQPAVRKQIEPSR